MLELAPNSCNMLEFSHLPAHRPALLPAFLPSSAASNAFAGTHRELALRRGGMLRRGAQFYSPRSRQHTAMSLFSFDAAMAAKVLFYKVQRMMITGISFQIGFLVAGAVFLTFMGGVLLFLVSPGLRERGMTGFTQTLRSAYQLFIQVPEDAMDGSRKRAIVVPPLQTSNFQRPQSFFITQH